MLKVVTPILVFTALLGVAFADTNGVWNVKNPAIKAAKERFDKQIKVADARRQAFIKKANDAFNDAQLRSQALLLNVVEEELKRVTRTGDFRTAKEIDAISKAVVDGSKIPGGTTPVTPKAATPTIPRGTHVVWWGGRTPTHEYVVNGQNIVWTKDTSIDKKRTWVNGYKGTIKKKSTGVFTITWGDKGIFQVWSVVNGGRILVEQWEKATPRNEPPTYVGVIYPTQKP